MAVSKASKSEQLDEIRQRLKESASFVLIDYVGITVKDDTAFRRNFREKGVEYKVYKNRLLKIALKEAGVTGFDGFLEGTTAAAFSKEPAAAAAAIIGGSKDIPKIKIKCGYIDGAFLDEDGVKSLAAMPSKETLLAMLLGVMQAPVRGLAVSLNAVIAGLARALQGVADKKSAAN
ncbi:MAG: 50S ribosomal protein L10 [Clostridiales bacterium]|jgi:large subunit ribosomal protein L10|nr:50S ribosomal protein L10 [Clostridiales bacterium]